MAVERFTQKKNLCDLKLIIHSHFTNCFPVFYDMIKIFQVFLFSFFLFNKINFKNKIQFICYLYYSSKTTKKKRLNERRDCQKKHQKLLLKKTVSLWIFCCTFFVYVSVFSIEVLFPSFFWWTFVQQKSSSRLLLKHFIRFRLCYVFYRRNSISLHYQSMSKSYFYVICSLTVIIANLIYFCPYFKNFIIVVKKFNYNYASKSFSSCH